MLKNGRGAPDGVPSIDASSLVNMRLLSVVAAASFVCACCAAPGNLYSNHILHEKRDGVPHQWGKRDRAAGHEVMPIRIGLRQRNLEHAERYMYEVSDPTSPNFGKTWMQIPKQVRAR